MSRRDPTNEELRLQAAQIIVLARFLDTNVSHLARALDACELRLQRDQIGAPARVHELINGVSIIPTQNGRKGGKTK